MEPIIKVENLKKVFTSDAGEVTAADDISFSSEKGDIFGIIGLTVAGIACFSKLKKFFQRF